MTLARPAHLPIVLLLLVAIVCPAALQGQAASSPARSSPEVLLDAKVLGIPASALSSLGLVVQETGPGASASPTGFAVVLRDGEAQTLSNDPRTKAVHSLKLQGPPGNPFKFRVDTRVPGKPSEPADTSYFEVGITFDVTPAAFPGRNIALSAASTVQIRQGSAVGTPASLVFETPPIQRDIQVPEGRTILLGGFLTSNPSALPDVPVNRDNPILSYVFSKSPRKNDEFEILVLLTPRLSGPVETVAAAAPQLAPKPDVPAVVPPTAPPPPKPSTQAVPPPKPDARFYTVQVGAFASSANAEILVRELKKKSEEAFVDKAPSGNTPYRVRVGQLPDLAAARRLQAKLSEQGFTSFVVLPDSR